MQDFYHQPQYLWVSETTKGLNMAPTMGPCLLVAGDLKYGQWVSVVLVVYNGVLKGVQGFRIGGPYSGLLRKKPCHCDKHPGYGNLHEIPEQQRRLWSIHGFPNSPPILPRLRFLSNEASRLTKGKLWGDVVVWRGVVGEPMNHGSCVSPVESN